MGSNSPVSQGSVIAAYKNTLKLFPKKKKEVLSGSVQQEINVVESKEKNEKAQKKPINKAVLKKILIGAGIPDRKFDETEADIDSLNEKLFAVLDEEQGIKMEEAILLAKSEQDSVGGILETAITGIPAGIGEPYFDSIESQLAHMLFSVPAVKGVEFGSGFDFAKMRGSEANDSFRIDENGKVFTRTNHNGGINGGISNGMPVTFRCAIKPTPSVSIEQETVDFVKNENKNFVITGRHDPAIIHRARVVIDSAAAIVLCDILAQRYGTDWLR